MGKAANIEICVPDRGLRPEVKEMPDWNIKLLKPRAIAEMLLLGTRDVAFLGLDLIAEQGYSTEDIIPVLDTGLDKVNIVVAAPQALMNQAKSERESLMSGPGDKNVSWTKSF